MINDGEIMLLLFYYGFNMNNDDNKWLIINSKTRLSFINVILSRMGDASF